MKRKILDEIDSFVFLCYMTMKTGAAEFASENFPKVVETAWDDEKSDDENLTEVKAIFESNKKLNEIVGSPAAVEVINAFQEGWLNKI